MRRLVFLLVLFVLNSCMSPMKTLEAGNHKRALQLAMKNVQKNKNVEENLKVLKQASKLLVAKEIYQGGKRLSTNKVSQWVDVQNSYYDLLVKLDNANAISNGAASHYYDELCAEKTALDFRIVDTFYRQGLNYMAAFDQEGQKFNARKAYSEYCECKKYEGELFFSDLPDLIDEAEQEGTVYYVSNGGYSNSSRFLKKLPADATFEPDCEVWFSEGDVNFHKSDQLLSTPYSKRVIVDYKIKSDTSGKTITTPMYDFVSANVLVTTVTLTAEQTSFLLVSNLTGQCIISSENHNVSKSDSYQITSINGDKRAVPKHIKEGSTKHSFFKSDLEGKVEEEIGNKMRSKPLLY